VVKILEFGLVSLVLGFLKGNVLNIVSFRCLFELVLKVIDTGLGSFHFSIFLFFYFFEEMTIRGFQKIFPSPFPFLFNFFSVFYFLFLAFWFFGFFGGYTVSRYSSCVGEVSNLTKWVHPNDEFLFIFYTWLQILVIFLYISRYRRDFHYGYAVFPALLVVLVIRIFHQNL
jgi:hypothetical protein